MNEEPNYLSHAFWSQYNVIGLATALGFALLSGSALPLILAAGAEMIVLPLVSGNERFQRLVRARVSDEKREEHEGRKQKEAWEMLQALTDGERYRYRDLQGLAGEIRHNYKRLDASSQMLLDDVVKKLDFLLSFYLRMRYSIARYDAYFASTDPERIQERIAMLDHEMQRGPERVQQIKARTKAVLLKRLERYEKAIENKQLIDAQTETVQEVLQLLRDQSLSMRDPKSIADQLDGLISSAEQTERGVRDMEDLLSGDQEALMPAGVDELLADVTEDATSSTPAQLQSSTSNAGSTSRSTQARTAVPPQPVSPPPPRRKITN